MKIKISALILLTFLSLKSFAGVRYDVSAEYRGSSGNSAIPEGYFLTSFSGYFILESEPIYNVLHKFNSQTDYFSFTGGPTTLDSFNSEISYFSFRTGEDGLPRYINIFVQQHTPLEDLGLLSPPGVDGLRWLNRYVLISSSSANAGTEKSAQREVNGYWPNEQISAGSYWMLQWSASTVADRDTSLHVPEPGTALLVILGLGAVAVRKAISAGTPTHLLTRRIGFVSCNDALKANLVLPICGRQHRDRIAVSDAHDAT